MDSDFSFYSRNLKITRIYDQPNGRFIFIKGTFFFFGIRFAVFAFLILRTSVFSLLSYTLHARQTVKLGFVRDSR